MGVEARCWALRVLCTTGICTDAALLASSAALATNGRPFVGRFVELIPEETLVAIGTAGSDTRVAGDETGPDGGEWKEDAHDGGALRGELGHFFVELEAGEDC
jgi:hypothetical protein